ncbi:MAG TPA: hypothetical protein VH208_11000 [Myxococcaceae bacterium]|nr:hypothetical protein [Myxococcaceae bacterium]
MTDGERALTELPAQSVGRLLESLVRLRERRDAGEKIRVPYVTLHLRSGRDVSGFVLKLGTSPGPDVNVLLHAPGNDGRAPDYDALYAPVSAIEAITVHDVPRLSTASADAGPAPSRLEVRGRIKELSDALSTALGTTIACALGDDVPEGEPMRAVNDTAIDASELLRGLAGEEAGLQALKDRLQSIQFSSSAQPTVELAAGRLTVTAAANALQRMSKQHLKAAIERLF